MKKLLTFLAIAALVAVSCAKEQESPYEGGSMVTYTIDGPAQVATKAMGTIGSAYTLYYEVRLWDGSVLGNKLEGTGLSGSKSVNATDWPTTVSFDLARGKQYKILFWAQSSTAPTGLYTTSNLTNIAIDYSKMAASNEDCDAFYGSDVIIPAGATSAAATLQRPFALVNLGTNDAVQFKTASGGCTVGDVKVTVKGNLASSFNVATGAPGAGASTNISPNAAPIDAFDAHTLVVNATEYNYLSAVYVLPATASDVIEVDYAIKDNQTTPADITSLKVTNVPVKANHRTNITGKLLTGTTTYAIDVDQAFVGNTNKNATPTFASIAALNTFFASQIATGPNDPDNGDIYPESVTVTAIPDGDATTITLPNDTLSVTITIQATYAGEGGLTIAYPTAEGAKHTQKVFFNMAGLNKLTANLPDTHLEVVRGSSIDLSDVHTSAGTFVVQKGARVGTLNVQQGNASIAGTVAMVSVPAGATADGTNPVQVFVEKVASVDQIELKAQADVVVEQPKDQIDLAATEKRVAVYVKTGADNSTAKAQNGGVIYVKAEVPCAVTVDGTSEAEDGSAVSSTVIIDSGAAGSTVTAENGGAINLTANDDCEVTASGSSTPEDPTETPVPSSVVIDKVDAGVEVNTETEGDATIEPAPDADIEGKISAYVAKNKTTEEKYTSLYDAVAAAESEDTIEMMDNSIETKGFTLAKSLVIDLAGFKVSYDSSAGTAQFPNTRAIKIAGSDAIAVTIKNGTIAIQDNIYGPFRFENSDADIVLNDLVLNNGMAYGLGIKLVNAKSLVMEGCTVNSVVGGGLEQNYACPVTISNCIFNQTELDTAHPWISSAVSVCYNGVITVDSGSYSGHTAAFVFSSGGTINISGGTFVGRDAAINVENNTWEPGYAASSQVNVTGGTFTGPLKVSGWGGAGTSPVSALNISGGTFTAEAGKLFYTNPGTISITGGTFSEDPSAYVPEGYIVNNNGDGTWTVVEDAVAQIGTTTYGTLAKAFAAVKANEEIVVLKNCEVKDHIDVDKSPVTLNLNGFTVKNSVTYARMFDVTASNGKLTINGNGKIYIDANENVNSYGFVRLQAYGSKFILDHAELEGVTENAALLRFNNGGQSMEIKNNSKLTLTAGPNVTNKGRGTIIYNYGMNNTLSITDTDIYNYCEAPQWSAMISMENRSCTFENVRYYSETGPTGFYTGAATYTNCSIELQRTGTLNIDWSYPWLMSAVSTSSAKEVTINSGTYKGYYGIFVYSSGGAITVKGGTFEGTKAVINSENNTWEPGYAGASSINIEGGDFTGQIMAAGWGGAGTNPVAAINISGGSFKVDSSEALFTPNNASILVSGGVFSQNPTPYLKSGYKVIDNPDSNANVYPFKVVAE